MEPHILLVTYPSQGHINPALQFAKYLVRAGAHVTFATSLSAHRRMLKPPSHPSLSYASFSDGYDQGFKSTDDLAHFMAQIKSVGSRTLTELVRSLSLQGRHVTSIVYTLLLPWVADVARGMCIPSVLLWIQPASVMSIYYHYFNGYDSLINSLSKGLCSSIEVPGLPPLSSADLPSFFLPSNPYSFTIPFFRELFESLKKEAQIRLRVLVNTYDALEPDAIKAMDSMDLIGIGPLIPSAFLDKTNTSDKAFGGDLFKKEIDYVEWLDAKPLRSVVYVSFGSISVLQRPQVEEIAKGLVESGRPFLWVIRPAEKGAETGTETDSDTKIEVRFWDGREVLGEEGLIVPWCSQVEVLSHPSVGCFVTHCGWNSTSEGLATGVPMVGFPQWTDQATNAKMVEDVWKTGVRVKVNEKGMLESGELKRCLEEVMGVEEIRKNAEKWKDLAREAAGGGGSSYRNIQAFVEEMKEESRTSSGVASCCCEKQ